MVEELAQMREEVPDRELDRARQYSKGRTLLRMEDTRSVAAWLSSQELLAGEVVTVEDAVERIEGVSPEDVARVAARLIDETRLKLAVVGPNRDEETLRELLRF